MAKTVLVTGCDGYIGHALTLKLLKEGYSVIGIDNLTRRAHVREMGSFSALPILSATDRTEKFNEIGNYTFYNYTTVSETAIRHLFRSHKIDTVVNLAQQPSAPYSQISNNHAIRTNTNNVNGVINLLWAIRKTNPDIHLVHIGTMGEYDPSVGVRIPEGKFRFWHGFRRSKESLFPRRPGSFYHTSKVAATYYIDFACRIWNMRATDIMQGVVYGNWTEEIDEFGLHTRFDSDEAFGTVFNRFVVQCAIGHPLTVYGKGKHKRGFLSLYDSIQCLMIAIKNPPKRGEYRTWNQLVEVKTMDQVADIVLEAAEHFGIKNQKIYIDTPRVEDTKNFYYKPTVNTLKKLGYEDDGTTMLDEAIYTLEYFDYNPLSEEQIDKLRKVVIPKITWR